MHRTLPTSQVDAVALKHDIDYLLSDTPLKTTLADIRAIRESDYSVEGLFMKAGLTGRAVLQLPFNQRPNVEVGQHLKAIVKNSIPYQWAFKKFGVDYVNW
jgi:hypothetical protein